MKGSALILERNLSPKPVPARLRMYLHACVLSCFSKFDQVQDGMAILHLPWHKNRYEMPRGMLSPALFSWRKHCMWATILGTIQKEFSDLGDLSDLTRV